MLSIHVHALFTALLFHCQLSFPFLSTHTLSSALVLPLHWCTQRPCACSWRALDSFAPPLKSRLDVSLLCGRVEGHAYLVECAHFLSWKLMFHSLIRHAEAFGGSIACRSQGFWLQVRWSASFSVAAAPTRGLLPILAVFVHRLPVQCVTATCLLVFRRGRSDRLACVLFITQLFCTAYASASH